MEPFRSGVPWWGRSRLETGHPCWRHSGSARRRLPHKPPRGRWARGHRRCCPSRTWVPSPLCPHTCMRGHCRTRPRRPRLDMCPSRSSRPLSRMHTARCRSSPSRSRTHFQSADHCCRRMPRLRLAPDSSPPGTSPGWRSKGTRRCRSRSQCPIHSPPKRPCCCRWLRRSRCSHFPRTSWHPPRRWHRPRKRRVPRSLP
jgi:hypothetical protein